MGASRAVWFSRDEQWERSAVKAVRRTREHEPQEWADYVTEAETWSAVEAPVIDGWDRS